MLMYYEKKIYVKFAPKGNTVNIPHSIDCFNKPTVYQY